MADQDEDLHKRAADIGKAVKDADDAKKKADDDRWAKLDNFMDSIGKRMDAIESKGNADPEPAEAARKGDPVIPTEQDDGEPADPYSNEYKKRMAQIQTRADSVAMAHNRRTPPPMSCETVGAYRRRLARDFQRESEEFKKVDLNTISGPAFEAIESRIYADSMAAASKPFVPEGQLIERVVYDQSGRKISSFYGQPKDRMSAFTAPAQHVVGINTKSS